MEGLWGMGAKWSKGETVIKGGLLPVERRWGMGAMRLDWNWTSAFRSPSPPCSDFPGSVRKRA